MLTLWLPIPVDLAIIGVGLLRLLAEGVASKGKMEAAGILAFAGGIPVVLVV